MAIASCPWGDIRQSAADAKAKGGEKLPPVAELVKRKGNPAHGETVFVGAGTCAKCHIANGEGEAVGPNLSGVGAKLPCEAIYESVLAPLTAISHSYETYTAVMEDGRSVDGMNDCSSRCEKWPRRGRVRGRSARPSPRVAPESAR